LHVFVSDLGFNNSRPTQPVNSRTIYYHPSEYRKIFFSSDCFFSSEVEKAEEISVKIPRDLVREFGVSFGFAIFAGFVGLSVTLVVEKFGGLIGGTLGYVKKNFFSCL
jgi:hypothetical protein